MGLQDHVPTVERSPWGILCLILNIIPFIAGVGTIIAAVRDGMDVKNIIFGILQFLLGFLAIGYIWSIIWGILIFIKSK